MIERTHATGTVFRTADSNLSQYLIHRGKRATCFIDVQDSRPVFQFIDSPDLRDNALAYAADAKVIARQYAEAGRIIRRLLLTARQTHAAQLRQRGMGRL